MDQNTANAIYNQYPWASDITLSAIIMAISKDKNVLADEMKRIKREFADLDDSSDEMKEVGKTLSTWANETYSGANDLIRTAARDIDPMMATAELGGVFSKAADVTGSALGDLTKSAGMWANNKYAKALATGGSYLFKGIGKGAAGIAASATVLAKVMSDYDLNMRSMIDFGALDENLNNYNKVKDAAAELGMSLQELQGAIGDSMYAFTNMGNTNTLQAQLSFAKLVKEIGEGVEGFEKLGYSYSELAQRVAQETKHVYDMNDITELDQQNKQNIIDSLKTSTLLATFLANATGDKRSELLAEREQMIEDMDLTASIKLNQEEINQLFGENAAQYMKDSAANLGMAFKAFGPEIQKGAMDALARGISNIRFDQNIEDDLGEDFAVRLNMLPVEARDMIVSMLNRVLQDPKNIPADEQWNSVTEAIKVLANEDLNAVYDIPELQDLRTDLEYAKRTMMLLENGRNTILSPDMFEDMEEKLEGASQAIDTVDEVRQTLRQTLNAILPRYETLQMGLDFFQWSLRGSVALLKMMLPDTIVDPFEEAESRFAEIKQKQSEDKRALERYLAAKHEEDLARKNGDMNMVLLYQQQQMEILGDSGYLTYEDLLDNALAKFSIGESERTIVMEHTIGDLKGTTVETDVKTGESHVTAPDGSFFRIEGQSAEENLEELEDRLEDWEKQIQLHGIPSVRTPLPSDTPASELEPKPASAETPTVAETPAPAPAQPVQSSQPVPIMVDKPESEWTATDVERMIASREKMAERFRYSSVQRETNQRAIEQLKRHPAYMKQKALEAEVESMQSSMWENATNNNTMLSTEYIPSETAIIEPVEPVKSEYVTPPPAVPMTSTPSNNGIYVSELDISRAKELWENYTKDPNSSSAMRELNTLFRDAYDAHFGRGMIASARAKDAYRYFLREQEAKRHILPVTPAPRQTETPQPISNVPNVPAPEPVVNHPMISTPQPTSLLDLIGQGESRGSYNASNRGTTGSADFNTKRAGKLLENMTIQEVMDYQAKGKNDPERLFAVGKYQFIPSSLKEAVDRMGYDVNEKFTPEMQDRIASEYFLLQKRGKLGAYLSGKTYNGKEVSVEEALYSMSKEWAAVPVGSIGVREKGLRPDQSYYSGDAAGNAANIDMQAALDALREARNNNLVQPRQPIQAKVVPPKPKAPKQESSSQRKLSSNGLTPEAVNNLAMASSYLDGMILGTKLGLV